jgi:hypothetical protein
MIDPSAGMTVSEMANLMSLLKLRTLCLYWHLAGKSRPFDEDILKKYEYDRTSESCFLTTNTVDLLQRSRLPVLR